GDYRFSKRINQRNRFFYEAGFDYIKDPKEVKVINPFFNSQKKFIFGKLHSFQVLRGGMGLSRTLIEKSDKGSIALIGNITGGGIIGFAKPIYYDLVDSVEIVGDFQYFYSSVQPLDIHKFNPSDIIGKGPFFSGISKTKIVPGIYLKLALSLDFSKNVMKSNQIETGVNLDFYFREVEIMAENKQQLFLSIYASYRFGQKYNANLSREARREK
ncbi:MAG: hypothetical protein GX879_01630, partial [Bacteroidales bacterium]|nr:hypothetical protein [Bacteroidales bacterium]